MAKETLWYRFLEYLRSKKIGEEFTRQGMQNNVIKTNSGQGSIRRQGRGLDTYRMLLTKCGYLERGQKRGRYKKVRPLPLMSLDLAVDKAYHHTWKSWFLEEKNPK